MDSWLFTYASVNVYILYIRFSSRMWMSLYIVLFIYKAMPRVHPPLYMVKRYMTRKTHCFLPRGVVNINLYYNDN